MLLDRIFLRRDGEVLRQAPSPVDPVGKSKAGEAEGVVPVETMGGDLDRHPVGGIFDERNDLEIFRMAKAMHVIASKAGHFPPIEILRLRGKEDEVVAEAGDGSLCLQIACVDKELDAIAAPIIALSDFLKGSANDAIEGDLFDIPPCIDVSERLLS